MPLEGGIGWYTDPLSVKRIEQFFCMAPHFRMNRRPRTRRDALTRVKLRHLCPAIVKAAPSVVNIHTAKVVTLRPHPLANDPAFRQFFGDGLGSKERKRLETSLGSGVIISEQGYILTNQHVIAGAYI